jgi:hypothetical protein
MSFYDNIVARTKEAAAPTEYEITLLSDNIRRKISTAAVRGESGVIINTGTDYFRSPNQGGKMVRSSAFDAALRVALSGIREEGFSVTNQPTRQVEITWG